MDVQTYSNESYQVSKHLEQRERENMTYFEPDFANQLPTSPSNNENVYEHVK